MVQGHRGESPLLWAAFESIAQKIGCVPRTLMGWIQPSEVDTSVRVNVTTAEVRGVMELESEVKEMRRAHETLKLTREFFGETAHSLVSPTRNREADSSPEGLRRATSTDLWGRADLQSVQIAQSG
jgi:hypothetical protein